MKKDWTYKKLGEVCDVLNGYAFKSDKYVDEGIRVIRIANVQKGIIVDDQPAFYPLATQSEINRYLLNEGDILMSLTGNVGRVGILQKEMLPAALNQRVACLRMINNALHSKFFFHYLNSDLFEQKCIASARGIAQLNMSTEWLKEQFIPIPPLSIQRSIVSELDLLHSLIEKKQEQLRALDNLAQSLFYQMFGDPITNPMGWEVKKLGEVCDVKGRIGFRGYTRNDFVDSSKDGAISLSPTNIINNQMDYSKCSYVTWDKYNESPEIMVKNGDILLVKTGSSYGKCAYVDFLPHEATINPQFVVIKEHKIISRYLTAYLQSEAAKIKYDEFVIGTAIPTFSQKSLNSMPILCPPLSLQQSFAAKVSAIEEQKLFISQSIKDVESLLAQRMDQYFA